MPTISAASTSSISSTIAIEFSGVSLEASQCTKHDDDESGDGQSVPFVTADSVVVPDDPASWIRLDLDMVPNENANAYSSIKGDNIIDFIIENLPKTHQDIDIDFSAFERQYSDGVKRKLTKSMFYSGLPNGEEVRRTWLMYSETSKKIYCLPCTLFCSNRDNCTALSYHGFNNWTHASAMLKAHEKSQMHRTNTALLIERQRGKGIDHDIKEKYEKEKQYWRALLKRLIPVIQFLSKRGLAFRGAEDIIGSPHNGNYLGILELISLFDDFLAAHIAKYANRGKGSTSYLSPAVCNELIALLVADVRNKIISEINNAKYFALILDSTPDVSHTDQFTVIFRYVNKEGDPVERFLQFTPISSHKAADLEETVINILNETHIDLDNCRGQCYDNASEMSGAFTGLQTRIRDQNKYAIYIPCTGHSLNLVGNSAAEKSCLIATKYFMLLQKLYTFLSGSTKRWKVVTDCFRKVGNYQYEEDVDEQSDENVEDEDRSNINEEDLDSELSPSNKNQVASTSGKLKIKSTGARFHVPLPKPVSFTRWSAKHTASKALTASYDSFKKVFNDISEDKDQEAKTRLEAKSILKKLSNFDMVFMAIVWDVILERIDAVNKSIQGVNTDLGSAMGLYGSLVEYFQEMRDNRFQEFYKKAAELSDREDEKRLRKRKFQFGESRDETTFNFKEKLQYDCYNIILDKLMVEMKRRRDAYEEVHNLFYFLINLKNSASDPKKIREDAAKLVHFYDKDLDSGLIEESVHFEQYLSSIADESPLSTPGMMLKHIIKNDLICTFPNIYIALQIYLTIPVTNASGERSFSVLKRIKNYLRSVLGQGKLMDLAILAIECEIANEINIDKIIDEFARKKLRRKVF